MINQLLLICSAIIIYELIKYTKLLKIIKSSLKFYKKILNIFKFKKASDFRKQKLLFNYSKSLFIVSIKIFIILLSVLLLIFILNFLSNSFLKLVVSILGIFEISIIFIFYHQIRKRNVSKL